MICMYVVFHICVALFVHVDCWWERYGQRWRSIDTQRLVNKGMGDRKKNKDYRIQRLVIQDIRTWTKNIFPFVHSSFWQDPNLNALVSRQCRNHDGIVKVCRRNADGYICQVALQAKQVLHVLLSAIPLLYSTQVHGTEVWCVERYCRTLYQLVFKMLWCAVTYRIALCYSVL